MTGRADLLIAVSLGYVALLFVLAALADARARRGRGGWSRSTLVYTLSLSVYCTAWTFYGAVGYAARSGLEFVTIYLGPTLVLTGWWVFLRKLVRIGRVHRITSIADLVSSRYGKSAPIGAAVTLIGVVAAAPYIALQLQSITVSAAAFTGDPGAATSGAAALVAAGLAAFAVLFGTRTLDVEERHHGVVAAIAVEGVVKLVALVAVGAFVVMHLGGGPAETFARVAASPVGGMPVAPGRWTAILMLSAAAFVTLPRMFQVLVVENADERHVGTAAWAFPLYLFAMSLFVMPIAAIGLERMPTGSNPDLFVLTLPLAEGREGLALLAFIGGFSSATSMVIVATLALGTMVSNSVVLPIYLARRTGRATVSGDVRAVTLRARRLSVAGMAFLGWLWLGLSGGGDALAAMGLISFVGVAQVLPAMAGGLVWRGATRWGAAAGLGTGFALWLWALVLPALGMAGGDLPALGGDPFAAAVLWSLGSNALVFALVSLATFPTPTERVQGAQFVHALSAAPGPQPAAAGDAAAEDLLVMVQRIVGAPQAQALFAAEAARQGGSGYLPRITQGFVERLERDLAGSVGAATAHAMIAQVAGGRSISARDLLAVADESAQLREYSRRLEERTEELRATTAQLRAANEKLTRLARQKDAFLGQVSHELRTPMTSIRAFSEILRGEDGLAPPERARFAAAIHDEGLRLTRLLDDLLEMSVLESGQLAIRREDVRLSDVIDRAVLAAAPGERLVVRRDRAAEEVVVHTDPGRLAQVFINLVSNAAKYCDAPRPVLDIEVRRAAGGVTVTFADNGSGIPPEGRDLVFEKFARMGDPAHAGGAGLGLAICRELMARLGGSITLLSRRGGAAFRVALPAEAGRLAAE